MTGGNALYDMFQSRRSSRYFKDAEIDEATLQTLLGSANYIPSGGNAHELVITVVRDAGTKRRLREAVIRYYERTINMTRIPLVKPLLRIFGDGKVKAALGDKEFEAKIRNMIRRDDKRDLVFYDAPAILVFHTARLLPTPSEDCILAAYNITLLAESLGLGTCFVSLSQQALSADQRCRSLIGIAAKEKVHAVLVLGYPLRKHRRIAPRTGVIVRSVRN
jgi:nitroreductase